MKKSHWSVWGAALVMAAAMTVGSVGDADARLGGGIRLPVDDTEEVNGIGANHQVSDGVAALRQAALGLIRQMLWILPEDSDWLKLPVYQTVPED